MRTIAIALAGAALLGACSMANEQKPEEIRPVRVLRIGASDGAAAVEFAAEVRPRHEVRLGFRVAGKVIERPVEVGSRVRAGQLLARLDPADLALASASAKAQAASLETERNLAAVELKRYRDLRERNFISQAEFDRRASTLEVSESRLQAAFAQARQSSNQMAYSALHADSAGVVTGIEADAGQVVAAGQTIVRLAREGEIEALFAVPEAQREMIQKGAELSVTLNAYPGRSWKARLRELSPAADPVTRTYAARATILEAREDIELGMSARVLAKPATAAPRIEVPVSALFTRGDKPQVLLVEQGTVRPQEVTTAGVSNERVAIAAGLKPGDVVVAAGAALLRPGQRVRVLEAR
jgi:RND family efflux transporter MFP subunit